MTSYMFLLVILLQFKAKTVNCQTRDILKQEVSHLQKLVPLKNDSYIMFWRPQKVGSSTVLSFLISYAYRYQLTSKRHGFANSFCWKMMVCLTQSNYSSDPNFKNIFKVDSSQRVRSRLENDFKEKEAERLHYSVSWSHQLCNLPAYLISASLPCGFAKDFNYMNRDSSYYNSKYNQIGMQPPSQSNIKEIFIVRDPLARMISVYYFWGELFRLKNKNIAAVKDSDDDVSKIQRNRNHKSQNGDRKKRHDKIERIGTKIHNEQIKVIKGGIFDYHGDESSVPDKTLALKFASKLPLKAGMPGPSYSWSAINNNYKGAIKELKTDRIMTIVTERLDESLVVASHYLQWSLADVIVVKNRKALSSHPKHTAWPQQAVEIMKKSLDLSGEYATYKCANDKLDERIQSLETKGIQVQVQVKLLQEMRKHVSKICLDHSIMDVYRDFMDSQGFQKHSSNNKLRDTDDWIVQNRHMFSYNGDIIHSYDVCANCEAHAVLLQISTLLNLPSVNKLATSHLEVITKNMHMFITAMNMSSTDRANNINFINCPSRTDT